ncbi:MAG: TlpA family protein disulfide reductase [Rhodobiaceae bacterium]|jgi:thiol-disulfide isomerase/thioredoxin|nr:TlpA family protein disulfide reductase [Rhodobiaceae bacterium]
MMKLLPIELSLSWTTSFNRACLVGLALLMFLPTASISAAGQQLPNIVGRDLEGNLVSLRRSLQGKKTLINFWWVQCSPCKQELPDLIAKEKSHPEVDFIYVHAETNAKTKSAYEPAIIQAFLGGLGLSLSKVIIGNTKSRMAAGVEALPTTLLVDESGKVEMVLVGFTVQNTAKIAAWLE